VSVARESEPSQPAARFGDSSGVDALLDAARRHLRRLSPEAAYRAAQHGAVLVDTRPLEQRDRDGTIPGAIVIDRNVLEWRLDPASAFKSSAIAAEQQVILICNEGFSSSLAAATLQQLGRPTATDVIGGFQNWIACGLPVAPHGRSPAALDLAAHWEGVYRAKRSEEMSWYQEHAELSLEMIMAAAPGRDARIVDVGGGDSRLVDALLQHGYQSLTVLDISRSAIERARARLGDAATRVQWIACDVLDAATIGVHGVWHDRALFHFFTTTEQRRLYINTLSRSVASDGAVIIATFAPDGPEMCSGLDVCRYDERTLAAELGDTFTVHDTRRATHRTPWGTEQRFLHASLRRSAAS